MGRTQFDGFLSNNFPICMNKAGVSHNSIPAIRHFFNHSQKRKNCFSFHCSSGWYSYCYLWFVIHNFAIFARSQAEQRGKTITHLSSRIKPRLYRKAVKSGQMELSVQYLLLNRMLEDRKTCLSRRRENQSG